MRKKEIFTPDAEWASRLSQEKNVVSHCPFATVETCPRYYLSVGLLGKLGVATKLKTEEDARLKAKWDKHPAWPKLFEEEPSVMGDGRGKGCYSNFCPEVMLDVFGLSSTLLADYSDDIDIESAHRRLRALQADSSDWRWRWADCCPLHYTDCRIYAVLVQFPEPTQEPKTPIGFL